MARPADNFYFTYEDLGELTGLPLDTVRQHRVRKKWTPDNIGSIVVYLARHGTPELKAAILNYSIRNDDDNPLVPPKRKRTAKKA